MNTTTDALGQIDPEGSLADDLLRGVKAISEFIDEPERRTSYLLERRYIPAGKLGTQWIASRRTLRAHYERITRGAA
jgi:hypothetical protein